MIFSPRFNLGDFFLLRLDFRLVLRLIFSLRCRTDLFQLHGALRRLDELRGRADGLLELLVSLLQAVRVQLIFCILKIRRGCIFDALEKKDDPTDEKERDYSDRDARSYRSLFFCRSSAQIVERVPHPTIVAPLRPLLCPQDRAI